MKRSPRWFKWVAGIALLWNLIGCLTFAMDLRLTPADIAAMPPAHQALYAGRPGWSVVATAFATIGGALGCLGLLLGRRWALWLLLISLAGIIVQDIGLFVLVDGARLAGPVVVVLQSVVLIVCIALVALARKGIARGWLV